MSQPEPGACGDPGCYVLHADPSRPIHPSATVVLADADALREYLDTLNEAGIHPIAVGLDARPSPFLITLVGPYTEGEHVFFDSPWQSDIDAGERVDGVWVPKQPECDECRAMAHGIEDLRFPVTVLTQQEAEHG